MPRKRTDQPANAFQATLRTALEHLHDPAWLAAHSPLAAAYFLGRRLDLPAGARPAARGEALRALLAEAMDRLWAGAPPPTAAALVNAVEEARREQGNTGDEYAYLLLELRYFRRHFPPGDYPAQTGDIPVFLHVSTTRYFVHLDQAIDRLGEELLRLVQPALRPERPPDAVPLIGRADDRVPIEQALAAGRSVTLTGAGGVGKTSLAASVAAGRPDGPVFWHTFLPNFNDNLPGLLFALGNFLNQQQPSALWLQLLADHGQVANPEQALGLLRADLDRPAARPLFCFDEVDLLHTADGDPRSAAHAQVLAFLEALSRMTPVLLTGQRAYIDTPVHVALEPLDPADLAAMLAGAGLELSGRQVVRVREATDGLPRLVELVIALLRDGDDFDEIVRLHLRADARPLFHRLWRRLGRRERELLIALSVFRGPAPGDAWPHHDAACRSLQQRRLLFLAEGEVTAMPFYRRLVYEELRAEQREAAHAQAAALRAARGEFTTAAYHYGQAGEPAAAVAVWFPNRRLEIERGQAGAALEIFGELSARRLPTAAARQLKIIQNQLYLSAGQLQRVVDNMAGVQWEIDDALAAEAHYHAGDAHRLLGNPDAALAAYEKVIGGVSRQMMLLIDSVAHRSRVHLLNGDMPAAAAEAQRAHFAAHSLDGYLAMIRGRFGEAEPHFRQALARLESAATDDPAVIAVHQNLGFIAGSRGDLPAAQHHYDIAIDYFRRIGNSVNMEGARADLSGVYLNLRRFEEFIPRAEASLRFFDLIGHEPRIAQLSADLAEAYLETGRADDALVYANRVLQLESPRQQPYALYTIGLVHQRQGRAAFAEVAFSDGISIARANEDRFIEAYLHRNRGRLWAEAGDFSTAREALATALDQFDAMGIAHEAAATRAELEAVPPPSGETA